jgi:hypothetical protein
VSEADVLRLALDGHLTLSVNFVNHTTGRCGPVVPPRDANWWMTQLSGNQQRRPVSTLQIAEDQLIELDLEVIWIDGVWDLTMLGAEQTDVEHLYQRLTGGPSVEPQTLEGPIVCREDGTHCQLQSHYSDNEFVNPKSLNEPRNHPANFYPAAGLPVDSVLVVRTSALHDLETRLAEPDRNAQKPLEQRERDTLLVIIAALAELAKIDVNKPAAAGATIESQTALLGAEVSSRAIQNHLKRIPEALERRSK